MIFSRWAKTVIFLKRIPHCRRKREQKFNQVSWRHKIGAMFVQELRTRTFHYIAQVYNGTTKIPNPAKTDSNDKFLIHAQLQIVVYQVILSNESPSTLVKHGSPRTRSKSTSVRITFSLN